MTLCAGQILILADFKQEDAVMVLRNDASIKIDRMTINPPPGAHVYTSSFDHI